MSTSQTTRYVFNVYEDKKRKENKGTKGIKEEYTSFDYTIGENKIRGMVRLLYV